jgi:hypothetical protein
MTKEILQVISNKASENFETIIYGELENIKNTMYNLCDRFLVESEVTTNTGDYKLCNKNNTDILSADLLESNIDKFIDSHIKKMKNDSMKTEIVNRSNFIKNKIIDHFKEKEKVILDKRKETDLKKSMYIILNDIYHGYNINSVKEKYSTLLDNSSLDNLVKENLKNDVEKILYNEYGLLVAKNNPESVLSGESDELKSLPLKNYEHILSQAKISLQGQKMEFENNLKTFSKLISENGYYDQNMETKIKNSKFYNEEYNNIIDNSINIFSYKKKIIQTNNKEDVINIIKTLPYDMQNTMEKYYLDITNEKNKDPVKFLRSYAQMFNMKYPTTDEELIAFQQELACDNPRLTSNIERDTYANLIIDAYNKNEFIDICNNLIHQKNYNFMDEIMGSDVFDIESNKQVKMAYNIISNNPNPNEVDKILLIYKKASDTYDTNITQISSIDKIEINNNIRKQMKNFIKQNSFYTDGVMDNETKDIIDSIYKISIFYKLKNEWNNKTCNNQAIKDILHNTYNEYKGFFLPKKLRRDDGELVDLNPIKVLSLIEKNKDTLKNIMKEENKKTYFGDMDNFDYHWDIAKNNIIFDFHIIRNRIYFSYHYGDMKNKNIVSKDKKPFYLNLDLTQH